MGFSRILIGRVLLVLLLTTLIVSRPGLAQPLSDESAAQLVRAALLAYFDPSSTFDISVTGARVNGDSLLIDDLTVSGRPAFVRGIRGEFLLRTTALQLQIGALYNQQIKVLRVGSATVVASSTAAAIAEALPRISSAVTNPTVRLNAGEFHVTAEVKREGKLYPTQVRGKFVVEKGQVISVAVIEVKVSGGDIPQDVIQKELDRVNPILDLSHWPLDLRIQRLTLHNDRVEVLAASGR